MPKLDKAVVLYMGPELLDKATDSPHGARCGKCMMFLADSSECSILRPALVSGARGVCGLFVGGTPGLSKDHPPMKLVPAEVAGYIKGAGVPTHCGNCRYFAARERACQLVLGDIDPNGCCNAWELSGSSEPRESAVLQSAAGRTSQREER